jgi:hypothetical protein
MNFTSKKRVRKHAWQELQTELDEREKLEEENTAKQRKLDALIARVCIEEEPNPSAQHVYMDFEIGRKMGRDPHVTRGRLIVELFDDIMPRTTERFVELLTTESAPTYRSTLVSKIMPGAYCIAGDRDTRMEGSSNSRDNIFGRIESEANWYAPAQRRPCLVPLRLLFLTESWGSCKPLLGSAGNCPISTRASSPWLTAARPASTSRSERWRRWTGGTQCLARCATACYTGTARTCPQLMTARLVQVVYGFDLLKIISEQGNTNGEPKQPVVMIGGGAVPEGKHPREFLQKLQRPEDPEAHGYNKKVMRYSSTYRHTGLIGN